MHVDMTQLVKQIDGTTPVTDKDGNPLSFASVVSNAVLAPEQNVTGEEQVKRFLLATRIYGSALPVEITVEEAALIKKCVAKACGPLVTGQVWQTLDPAPTPAAPPALKSVKGSKP